jgi:hypothetical protein
MTPPPSPAAGSTSTTNTATIFFQDDDEDPLVALQRIFTPKVYKDIAHGWKMPHRSMFGELSKFVNQRTLKSNGPALEASADVLLRFYGIQKNGVLSKIASRCRHPFAPAQVDHVQNIKALAEVFIEQNPGGGTGYSFGALLDRYLKFQFLYLRFQLAGIKDHVIGGDRNYILSESGHDIEDNVAVPREGGAPAISITLHWLQGTSLIRTGPEPVVERVARSLQDFGIQEDPKFLYLCHGTDILSATSIVKDGPDPIVGAMHGDFGGSLFYLTDSLPYAVFSACQSVENSKNPIDPAIVVFPIPRAALVGHELALQNLSDWKRVVERGCRQKRIPDGQLKKAYIDADCISGKISHNATLVDQAREEPRPAEFAQWAFKESEYTDNLFNTIYASGDVHVFRILFSSHDEWRSAPPGRQGRVRFGRRGRR